LIANDSKSLIINQAIEKKIYDSHVWHRLLHLDVSEKPSINTPAFLISYSDFTPKNELIKTIDSFFEDNRSICKYPARFYWIKNELSLNDTDFPQPVCPDFDEYLEKTNPKNLKLVFVSEQVKSPSSMMGHTFFKLEGVDENGEQRQNAVSFFTVIDTVNIPYLIMKSTLIGMKGFFILSPYETQKNRYLNEEDRNIWEYDLNLSAYEKRLIYYHFWELKDIDITYLFTGFNCATIVDDMLGIVDKNYKDKTSLWITPKDVIKKANEHKLLNSSVLIPSNTWELSMLSESLPSERIAIIQDIVKNKKIDELENFKYSDEQKNRKLEEALIGSYTDYLHNSLKMLNDNESAEIQKLISTQKDDYLIDLSKYKNPLKTFDDSQLSLYYQRIDHEDGVKINFLPASNTLYDDNREYFSESSLSIGEVSVLINNKNISIDTLNVFAMKSLIPWNSLTQNLSADFKLNYEKHYTSHLDTFHAVNASGGIGISKKIHDDVLLYGLMDLGIAYGNETFYPYLFPQLGLMIYEIFNMKSTLEYKYVFNQDDSHNGYHDFNLEQSLFIDKKYRIGASYNKKSTEHASFDSMDISFNYFF
jgi:hypothetical protein